VLVVAYTVGESRANVYEEQKEVTFTTDEEQVRHRAGFKQCTYS
jgi:hypothetical protein